MSILTVKIKEVLKSTLPIIVIVLLMNFLIPTLHEYMFKFILSTLVLILGFSLFLVGVDIGIEPLGERIGSFLIEKKKIFLFIFLSFIFGFFISMSEPSLLVLAGRIEEMSSSVLPSFLIIGVVSVGIGIAMVLGLMRIILNLPLYIIIILMYTFIFIMSFFVSPEIFAIAFDASGATTGVITVPFILAISVGLSASKRDSKSSEKDSFGLIAIVSAGAIISVLLLGLLNEVTISGKAEPMIILSFFQSIVTSFTSSLFGLIPIVLIFIYLNTKYLKLEKKNRRKILFGLGYSLLGLFMLLFGANYGYIPVGNVIGENIAFVDKNLLLAISFVIGFITILAEPALHVLTNQIEDVTAGYINKKTILYSIAIGGGFAIFLSVLKILNPGISLFYLLLFGYGLTIVLSFLAPKLFVGIAFDAGGVATGPMTATFIFAFIEGIATINNINPIDSLGMISLVALAPIICVQTLGVIFSMKSKKSGGIFND